VKSVLSITSSHFPCHATDVQVQFFWTWGRIHKVYIPTASISRSTIIITIISVYFSLCGSVEKVQHKVVPAHIMKAYKARWGIPPLILNLCIRQTLSGSYDGLATLPLRKNLGTHWTEGWVGPRAGQTICRSDNLMPLPGNCESSPY
jgi:hypothetical protein